MRACSYLIALCYVCVICSILCLLFVLKLGVIQLDACYPLIQFLYVVAWLSGVSGWWGIVVLLFVLVAVLFIYCCLCLSCGLCGV